MFREMRRKRQLLDYNECIKLLENGTSGVQCHLVKTLSRCIPIRQR